MKCVKCGTDVYARENYIFYLIDFILIVLAIYFGSLVGLFILALGNLACAIILNSQRPETTDGIMGW